MMQRLKRLKTKRKTNSLNELLLLVAEGLGSKIRKEKTQMKNWVMRSRMKKRIPKKENMKNQTLKNQMMKKIMKEKLKESKMNQMKMKVPKVTRRVSD